MTNPKGISRNQRILVRSREGEVSQEQAKANTLYDELVRKGVKRFRQASPSNVTEKREVESEVTNPEETDDDEKTVDQSTKRKRVEGPAVDEEGKGTKVTGFEPGAKHKSPSKGNKTATVPHPTQSSITSFFKAVNIDANNPHSSSSNVKVNLVTFGAFWFH